MKKLTFIVLLFLFAASAIAQTIHKDELDSLRISFDLNGFQSNSESYKFTIIDFSLEADKIDRENFQDIDPYGMTKDDSSKYLMKVWYGLVKSDIQNVTLSDTIYIPISQISPFGINKSIITFWEILDDENLRYLGAFTFPTDCSNAVRIEKIGRFPDNSTFLLCHNEWGYHGEMCDGFYFLRKSDKNSKFQLFFTKSFERNVLVTKNKYHRIALETNKIEEMDYTVFLNHNYNELLMRPDTLENLTILQTKTDSIRVDTINLWQLAQEKLNLK